MTVQDQVSIHIMILILLVVVIGAGAIYVTIQDWLRDKKWRKEQKEHHLRLMAIQEVRNQVQEEARNEDWKGLVATHQDIVTQYNALRSTLISMEDTWCQEAMDIRYKLSNLQWRHDMNKLDIDNFHWKWRPDYVQVCQEANARILAPMLKAEAEVGEEFISLYDKLEMELGYEVQAENTVCSWEEEVAEEMQLVAQMVGGRN